MSTGVGKSEVDGEEPKPFVMAISALEEMKSNDHLVAFKACGFRMTDEGLLEYEIRYRWKSEQCYHVIWRNFSKIADLHEDMSKWEFYIPKIIIDVSWISRAVLSEQSLANSRVKLLNRFFAAIVHHKVIGGRPRLIGFLTLNEKKGDERVELPASGSPRKEFRTVLVEDNGQTETVINDSQGGIGTVSSPNLQWEVSSPIALNTSAQMTGISPLQSAVRTPIASRAPARAPTNEALRDYLLGQVFRVSDANQIDCHQCEEVFRAFDRDGDGMLDKGKHTILTCVTVSFISMLTVPCLLWGKLFCRRISQGPRCSQDKRGALGVQEYIRDAGCER
jgi:hypothetical protein